MASPMVMCNVANCTFWGEGNKCQADSILVEIDAHAGKKYDMEASKELDGEIAHEDAADRKADTCCHTFSPRE